MSGLVRHVTVIGGGLMGSGIAQVAAQAGNNVVLVDLNNEVLKKAQTSIQTNLQRVAKKMHKEDASAAEKFVAESLGRLKSTVDIKEAIGDTDLVIEAVVENMNLKHKIFSQLDEIAPEHTIFASNTSSLSIAEIASVVKRKDKFGGLHFFNPVPVMKLLEVIRIPETSDNTYQTMMSWGKSVGKTCITCKDTPGFVVNRLLVPYMAEAVRLLERGYLICFLGSFLTDAKSHLERILPRQDLASERSGDASARDIDTAMKLGAGYPMGPLELADYVGHDTTKAIIDGWHKKFPEEPLFKPIKTLDKMVAEGKLGIKSGEGFYNYKK